MLVPSDIVTAIEFEIWPTFGRKIHIFSCFLLTDKVAMKILDKTRMDTQVQRLLSREISSMEVLRNPNVLHLYEVVETPSRLHLVLEYAGGGDLHNKICNEGKLSDNTSKITFAQILSAIKYMVSFTVQLLSHSHHLLHFRIIF